MVEKEDVLDAMSTFIATYIATLPEARAMDSKQLQAAILRSFQVSNHGGFCIVAAWRTRNSHPHLTVS